MPAAWGIPPFSLPLLPGIGFCETISEWGGRTYWPHLGRDEGVWAFHDWLGDLFPGGLGDWFQKYILQDPERGIEDMPKGQEEDPRDLIRILNDIYGYYNQLLRGEWDAQKGQLQSEGWHFHETITYFLPPPEIIYPGPGQQPPPEIIYPGPGQQPPVIPPVIIYPGPGQQPATPEITPEVPDMPYNGIYDDEDPTGPVGPGVLGPTPYYPPAAVPVPSTGKRGAVPGPWVAVLRALGFQPAKVWMINAEFGTAGAIEIGRKRMATRKESGDWTIYRTPKNRMVNTRNLTSSDKRYLARINNMVVRESIKTVRSAGYTVSRRSRRVSVPEHDIHAIKVK